LHNARGVAVGRLRPVVVLDKAVEGRDLPGARGRR